MAVPSSGSLSMLDMAQEALYATYGTGSVTGPISLYDMTNGGNTKGSGNSYPTVNTSCTPNPATGITNSTTITYIFKDEIDASIDVAPVYYSGTAGVNTVLYTSPCSSSTLPAGNYITSMNTFGCTNSYCYTYLVVNSSGVVTNVTCDYCP
tara:strand:+ start:383 stop:835 length:453 start_codon:yes stop_codon:yes gene_type:complete